MSRPSVLYLLAGRDVSAWWRVERPILRLQEAGYPCAWAMIDDVTLPLLGASYDVVVMPRLYWSDHSYGEQLVHGLKRQGISVLYEVDDDWYSPGVSERLVAALPGAGTVAEQEQARADRIYALTLCDCVIASSPALADVCRRYTQMPVVVVPNAVDADWWAEQLRDHERLVPGLTVGWLGGARLEEDLDQVAVAWGRIAERYLEVNFVVSGTDPGGVARYVPPHRVWPIPWQRIDAYPRALANIDIACCAVADNDWNRCKTPIKAWEATLSGAAVVATPTLYRDVVADGWDGLLAETADEWEHALSLLIDHPVVRRRFQGRMCERVLRDHSLTSQMHRGPEAWLQLVGDGLLVGG